MLAGAAGGHRHPKSGGADVIGHIDDGYHIVFAKREPEVFDLAAELFDGVRHGGGAVLRVLEHRGPSVAIVRDLEQVTGHERPPLRFETGNQSCFRAAARTLL